MRLRRLLPRSQASRCIGCGALIVERRRKPCPTCGSRNRVVAVGWRESFLTEDEFGDK